MNCIPRHLVDKFIEELDSGRMNKEKLIDLGPEGRHKYFSEILGEPNAKFVNAMFEKSILLKSQKEAFKKFVDEATGMKPNVRRDLITKVNRMETLLSPERSDAFMRDLVEHKLGIAVTSEEASALLTLAKDFAMKREKVSADAPDDSVEALDAGMAEAVFKVYASNLKYEAQARSLKEYLYPSNWAEAISKIGGIYKSLRSTFDNSVIGRQGREVLVKEPKVWMKNAKQSYINMAKTMSGEDMHLYLMARMFARKNYRNGLYKQYKLAVSTTEDFFPISIGERLLKMNVPLELTSTKVFISRLFSASEVAYSGFLYETRADLFDMWYEAMVKNKQDTTGLGEHINSMTGRANLGKFEPANKLLTEGLFSPRWMASNVDTMLFRLNRFKEYSPDVMKKAADTSKRLVGLIALMLITGKAVDKDFEIDWRAGDFGRLHMGGKEIDLTFGMASYITLAARLLPFGLGGIKTKYDVVVPLNTDEYGSKTSFDVINSFLAGKASPLLRMLSNVTSGKNPYTGEKTNAVKELTQNAVSIGIENAQEIYKRNRDKGKDVLESVADTLTGWMLEAQGISVNAERSFENWETSRSKVIKQFAEKVGEEKLRYYNNMYNEKMEKWLDKEQGMQRYQKMSNDEKLDYIKKASSKFKDEIFEKANFEYKPEKKKKLPSIR